jgi:predicted aminopeptidase
MNMTEIEQLTKQIEIITSFHSCNLQTIRHFLRDLTAAAREEGEEQGERAAVLRIRKYATRRSNLPDADYYEVDADILDEFDD